ncbi:MAG: hypothetical protein ACRDRH_16120 [Pseudonocardia sp.]
MAVAVVLGAGALIGYPQLDRSEHGADSSVEQPAPVVELVAVTVFGASFTSFPAEEGGDRLNNHTAARPGPL